MATSTDNEHSIERWQVDLQRASTEEVRIETLQDAALMDRSWTLLEQRLHGFHWTLTQRGIGYVGSGTVAACR